MPPAPSRMHVHYTSVPFVKFVRRPLLSLFIVGCGVSILVSGRFSARLVADGMASFAFIPVFEAASLALVWRWNQRRVPFARAVDRFGDGDAPWLAWLLAMIAARAAAAPLQAPSVPRWGFWLLLALAGAAAVQAARIDLAFFRTTLAPARPVRALVVQRLVGWTCAAAYFIGLAAIPII